MPINLQAIADVCNCGPDLVQCVLQVIRDEIVDIVQSRKGNVKLGLMIGELLINGRSQVQFRSKSIAEVAKATQSTNVRLTENNLKELSYADTASKADPEAERRSRQSIAERSINYMQKRQAASSYGSRASRSNKPRSVAAAKDIFEADDKPYQDDIGEAPYFQKRMMSRSHNRHSNSIHSRADANSRPGSRRLRTNDSHEHLNEFIQS